MTDVPVVCFCVSKLGDLSDSLQDPLRVPQPNPSRLAHMDLPLYPGDKVHCTDVLLSLAKQATSLSRYQSCSHR